jgi:riboflavin synthase
LFTGLIEEVGKVASLRRTAQGARLTVRSTLDDLAIGESVAVNGVCQTVVEVRGAAFSCDVLAETLRVSNLGVLRPGAPVNLERALRPRDRMGGHIVNGHVDGIGTVEKITRSPLSLEISVEPAISKFLVPKGSVAVDGISLTVGPAPSNNRFTVFIIQHTWNNTNLHMVRSGAKVNIEVDILGKYILNFLRQGGDGVTNGR